MGRARGGQQSVPTSTRETAAAATARAETAPLTEKSTDRFTQVFGTQRGSGRQRRLTHTVRNASGHDFLLRVIEPGKTYGNSAVNNSEQSLVEVYDAEYAGKKDFTAFGQVVGSWNLSTLLERTPGQGWDLHGGIAKWYLDARACDEAIDFLRDV